MCNADGLDNWNNYVAEQCNDALLRLRSENADYTSAVKDRTTLSDGVDAIMRGNGELLLSVDARDNLCKYIEAVNGGADMAELIACYKQGFRDAMRIMMDTGALPHQK
jgi:hypothetical protein